MHKPNGTLVIAIKVSAKWDYNYISLGRHVDLLPIKRKLTEIAYLTKIRITTEMLRPYI